MGSGVWNTDAYTTKHTTLRNAGKSSFGYHDDHLTRIPRDQWKPHEELDVNGVNLRESRDSDEHPTSLAVTVLFDVTGSMHRIPRALQAKLADLFGLLLRKGYVEHPQLMFGGIGDATCDRVPIQISQWESDNRSDDQLGNLVLEGGGGGQKQESYELSMYFMARHTAMDCLEKRGKKGYLFMIGDEMARDVDHHMVNNHLDAGLEEDIPLGDIVEELKEKFEVFFIIPTNAGWGRDPEIQEFWNEYFPERVILLDDTDLVCETIATTIGLAEGTVDLDEAKDHLAEQGRSSTDIESVETAVSKFGENTAVTAKVEGNLPAAQAGGADAERL